MPLTREEAQARASVITPQQYDVQLNLDVSPTEFESRTVITFEATPGAETFLDLDPVRVESIELNGESLALSYFADRTIHLPQLQARNEVVVQARMRFSQDGQGLHRAVDPVDGESYVFGHLFMDAAPRVFACFDQPDLKAPFTFTITAPHEWTVLTNAPMRQGPDGVWRGRQAKPLATYFVTVCAGPYVQVVDEHREVRLGVHARASLRDELIAQAPEILDLTKTFFDYYAELFEIPYPFGEYHQVFVPEFNAGAMENPGCVTFRDTMIFTGSASDAEVLNRANTVAHEMAHMWCGDLVTMQWWEDLWLNESFAEYLANRTLVATGTFPDAWVDVAASRKAWGYAAERSPSTHPVAGSPAPDTDTALQNFDGISYAKGSAALRQLIATVGDAAFVRGVRTYLRDHAYGNAALADFLQHVSAAAGMDVERWAETWLRTPGMDTLRCDVAAGGTHLVVEPDERFAFTRSHHVTVTAYRLDGQPLAHHTVADARGWVALPAVDEVTHGADGADVVLIPNSDDGTWAGVAVEDEQVGALARVSAGTPDTTTRAVVWTAFAHGLASATVNPKTLLDAAEVAIPAQTHAAVLDVAINTVRTAAIGRFLRPEDRPDANRRLAAIAESLMAGPTSAQVLAGYRLLAQVGAPERVDSWLRGDGLPAHLGDDPHLRWSVAANLAAAGALTVSQLDAVLDADATMSGRLGYLTARAARPDAADKEWAWQELTTPPAPGSPAHSNYELNALASGFWRGSEAVLEPFIERYVEDIPAMQDWVGQDALARVAALAFPSAFVSERLDVEVRRMLERDVNAAVFRAVTDQHALAQEVIRSRRIFGY